MRAGGHDGGLECWLKDFCTGFSIWVFWGGTSTGGL